MLGPSVATTEVRYYMSTMCKCAYPFYFTEEILKILKIGFIIETKFVIGKIQYDNRC